MAGSQLVSGLIVLLISLLLPEINTELDHRDNNKDKRFDKLYWKYHPMTSNHVYKKRLESIAQNEDVHQLNDSLALNGSLNATTDTTTIDLLNVVNDMDDRQILDLLVVSGNDDTVQQDTVKSSTEMAGISTTNDRFFERDNSSSEEILGSTPLQMVQRDEEIKAKAGNKLLSKTVKDASKVLEEASPDESESQVEKLAEAIAESYKKLDSDTGQQVVVAYNLQEKQHDNIEDVMIKDETEKLKEELDAMKKLSDKVKTTSQLLKEKKKYTNNSHDIIKAILKYADSLLKRNRPEISINIGGEESVDEDGNVLHGVAQNGWSNWIPWSECTMQCGLHSYQFRYRICLHPDHCFGEDKERKQCLGLPRCMMDHGLWSSWSQWSPCPVACGTGGVRKRYRDCQTDTPCAGRAEATEQCAGVIPCDGESLGTAETADGWSACSIACGPGMQYKVDENGKQVSRPCQTNTACDGLAHWQKWQTWGPCTVTCGVGVRVKARVCTTRTPAQTCHGDGIHTEACNIPCHSLEMPSGGDPGIPQTGNAGQASGAWTAWSDWTSCSVSCGVGVEIKYRRCKGECYGNTQLRRPCVKDSCQNDNVGFAERLLEGDSSELSCPVEDLEDTGEVIWISPDGTRIGPDSTDKRFRIVGKNLEIVNAASATEGTYHCIVTHSSTGLVESGDISLAVTTCESLPCKHGGTCEETPNELIPWLAFTCHCPKGTVGTFCELKLSYSTEFWILTAIITSCSILCLCFAVFSLSWKEQLEDHGPGSINLPRYFNNLFTHGGCRLPGAGNYHTEEDDDIVRIDVSRPEGRGWLSRICQLLRCNRRHPEPSIISEETGTESGSESFYDSSSWGTTSRGGTTTATTATSLGLGGTDETALTPPAGFDGMPDVDAINAGVDALLEQNDLTSVASSKSKRTKNTTSHNSADDTTADTSELSDDSSSSGI